MAPHPEPPCSTRSRPSPPSIEDGRGAAAWALVEDYGREAKLLHETGDLVLGTLGVSVNDEDVRKRSIRRDTLNLGAAALCVLASGWRNLIGIARQTQLAARILCEPPSGVLGICHRFACGSATARSRPP